MFIACGLVESKGLTNGELRTSAEETLALVAVQIGFHDPVFEKSAKTMALREARHGHCEEAYAIASRQGQNLYVDFARDALSALVDDALSRGDVDCAVYIAERPSAPVGHVDAEVWQRIADKQIARGETQQAGENYRKGAYALTDGHIGYQRSEHDVRRALQLADAMRTAGLTSDSAQLVKQAHQMLVKIYPRNIDGRLAASMMLAPALWRVGEPATAKQLLADVCDRLARYDETGTGKIRKVQHLLAAGDAAALIAILPKPKSRQRLHRR